jgi:hypothetical protein
MINYAEIENDIKTVEKLKGTYGMDSTEFYSALENVLAYAKEQRELDLS